MSTASGTDPWSAVRRLPPGSLVEIVGADGRTWTGTLLPPSESAAERSVTLKLSSGYNVGIRLGTGDRVRVVREGAAASPHPPVPAVPPAASDGRVELLTTGGTIASRVDYETGGVRPVRDESEILSFYPELRETGHVRIVPVMDRLSENIVPQDWSVLAAHVVEAFGRGARGVVIAHGTDTMGFTAAALSFLLTDLPGPVVLVGAQRSPDRPSSDGPSNIAAAVTLARDRRLGEVVVVMHAASSDARFAVHRGSWVRKMHSSRRDAFRSRNGPVLGWVDGSAVELSEHVRPPSPGPARSDGPLETRVGLLWSYPGLGPDRAERFVDGLRGVVVAGTGLGHTSSAHLEWIRAAVARGVVVAMTTQCLEGEVDPYVYATGRELARAGVLYLDDLLPETAYAKLAWALGRSSDPTEVGRLLKADRAGEFVQRRRPEGPAG